MLDDRITEVTPFNEWSAIAQKTNCPFNIRWSARNNWIGSHGQYKGFVRFDSLEYGVRSGLRLIASYIRRGYSSISSIITRYAPPSENKTSDYIGYVTASFEHYGINVSHIEVGSDAFFVLCRAIAIYETRIVLPFNYLYYVFDKWTI